VNVGRSESVDRTDLVVAAAVQVQLGIGALLVLDIMDDAEWAPGDVTPSG